MYNFFCCCCPLVDLCVCVACITAEKPNRQKHNVSDFRLKRFTFAYVYFLIQQHLLTISNVPKYFYIFFLLAFSQLCYFFVRYHFGFDFCTANEKFPFFSKSFATEKKNFLNRNISNPDTTKTKSNFDEKFSIESLSIWFVVDQVFICHGFVILSMSSICSEWYKWIDKSIGGFDIFKASCTWFIYFTSMRSMPDSSLFCKVGFLRFVISSALFLSVSHSLYWL